MSSKSPQSILKGKSRNSSSTQDSELQHHYFARHAVKSHSPASTSPESGRVSKSASARQARPGDIDTRKNEPYGVLSDSMSEAASSSGEEEVGVLIAAKDKAFKPLKLAVSKPARRVYLNTALFIFAALFFLGTAIAAYLLLYYTYIPPKGFSRQVHLQYDADRYPYGSVPLGRALVSDQPYDIKVVLHLPRTPANKAAGNFMVNIDLLAAGDSIPTSSCPSCPCDVSDRGRILASARRPTILPYKSEMMEYAHKISGLAWYILGFSKESEVLEVKMMEGVEFPRGWRNLPSIINVEIQSGSTIPLQIYDVTVFFKSRLRGLRYLMYNYRVMSFIFFTTSFWATAMGISVAVWAALSMLLFTGTPSLPSRPQQPHDTQSSKSTTQSPLKREPSYTPSDLPPLSDTEHTFPSVTNSSRNHPLHFKLKKEEEAEVKPAFADIPLAAEADVEDEDEDMDFVGDNLSFHDSGIGTSMESSAEKEKREREVRRRSGMRRAGERVWK